MKRAVEAAVEFRHELHRHPEISWHEVETTKRIIAKLEALGIPIVKKGFAGTECGLIAEVKGEKPGPTLMIRADIDALPVTENPDLPYRSECEGAMHACGHDAHISVMTAVAQIVNEHKDELCGTVKFLFQPAEEAGTESGAPAVIADGALEGVDAIIGQHIWSMYDFGVIGWAKGPMMGSADIWDITIHGKGGHGSQPHFAVNPMLCAAALIHALTAITPQEVSALEPVVVGIGSIKSGDARNIIPDTCVMSGTVRCSNKETSKSMPARFKRIAEGTAAAWNCTVDVNYQQVYPVVVNDPDLTQWMIDVVKTEGLGSQLKELEFNMASEDFSHYGDKVPAAFIHVGMGTGEPHHSPAFRVDDAVMPLCIKIFTAFALDFGKTHGKKDSAE